MLNLYMMGIVLSGKLTCRWTGLADIVINVSYMNFKLNSKFNTHTDNCYVKIRV